MRYSSRFFLYAPFVLLLALAIGVGLHWRLAAGSLDKRLDAMNGHEAIPGVTLSFASKSVGGFPFRLDAVFTDFQVRIATPHGPAIWSCEKFALHRLTYGRAQTIFEAAGKQLLTWTDAAGHIHEFEFVPGSLRADSLDDEKGLARFDLDLVGLGSPALIAARLQFHIRRDPAGNDLEIAVEVDKVHLSPRLTTAFGDNIDLMQLNASAVPSAAFENLRAGKAAWPGTLDAWREQGGNLHIDHVEIAWGRLDANGAGTVALDQLHRPMGLLNFRIAGMVGFIERAASQGVTKGPGKGIAPALLDRAAKAGSDASGHMGAVLGFKDGIAFVGDEPAGTVEPLY